MAFQVSSSGEAEMICQANLKASFVYSAKKNDIAPTATALNEA